MNTITASEFRARCYQLLDEVHRTGTELVVTKHGRAVVRVVPENFQKPWLVLRGCGRFQGDPFQPPVAASDIVALR